MKYLIDHDGLEAGDIILTSDNTSISKIVRLSTNSEFSHAILYVGDSSFIHSDANGVHAGNLQRLLFSSDRNVSVLRVNCSYNERSKACVFARSKIGTSYSVKDAINAKLKLKKKESENRQFCSRLVVQSYEFAGVPLVSNPVFCTPQEICESHKTYELPIVARPASEAEMIFATGFDLIKKQAEVTNNILINARRITNKDIQTLEQILNYLIQEPMYDREISKVIKDSGYLTMWEYEVEKNKWRYDAKLFMSLPMISDELVECAELEFNSAKRRLELYEANYRQYLFLRGAHQLEYLDLHIWLYDKLIKNTKKNIAAANFVLSMLAVR